MAVMADTQRASFEDRLKRIKSGGPNTMGEILVGAVEDADRKRKRKPQRVKRKAQPKSIAVSPFADVVFMPIAFLFGMICMQAGRIGSYHLFTEAGAYPTVTDNAYLNLGGDVGLAVVLALIFSWTFHLMGTGPRRIGLLLGLLAVYFGEPYLMGLGPDAYMAVYSDAHVIETMVKTPGI